MPFPNFAGKHAHDAFVTPRDLLAYRRRTGALPNFPAPDAVIVCYHLRTLRGILDGEEARQVEGFGGHRGGLHLLAGGRLGLCGGFGIGAPAVTVLLEELIALGVTRFLTIGSAGALQAAARPGDIIVCDRAVRDEGVSHHYLEPAEYADAPPILTARLAEALTARGDSFTIGASWTIDALYRETVEEARHYQRAGVLTVDMEAAAVFAVARYRCVDLAAAFVVSDSLADLAWDPQMDAPAVDAGFALLYAAARDTLLAAPPAPSGDTRGV